MNRLDEQVRADQRLLLSRWKIPFRQIGKDIAPSGIKDDNIIPFLHGLKRPALFTHDQGFFHHDLVHPGYCLVCIQASDIEAALYIRRFLKHPRFDTHSKRMGVVARAHHDAIHFWQRNRPGIVRAEWQEI
ncbi:MAG: hypothetical protein QOJ40_602 [Verrucomicrobiota bacterium]